MIRRRLPTRLVLLLATMAWLLGSVAAFVHVIKVRHAVCADHGQVIELGQADPDELANGPTIAPAQADRHDHGCSMPAQGTPTLATYDTVPVGLAEPPSNDEAPPALPPVPAPLTAAPKTSPPALS